MKTFHIRDALSDSSWGTEANGIFHPAFVQCVYIVREEYVFYVGMTESDFGSRLRWHSPLKAGGRACSPGSGSVFIANWPESLEWKVELWKPDEIQCEIAPHGLRSIQPFALRDAERCAIRRFSPATEFWRSRVSRRAKGFQIVTLNDGGLAGEFHRTPKTASRSETDPYQFRC